MEHEAVGQVEPVELFDTHCHLDVAAFDPDRDVAIARARAAGVAHFLNPAYDLESSRRAVALAQGHADVVAAVGVHPNAAADFDGAQLAELRALACAPQVVAVGEIGLDYYWQTTPRDRQAQAFIEQLALARELNLPVIVHCRDAYDDALALLREHGCGLPGLVMHAFSGRMEHLRAALALDFYIGVGGPVTYPNADTLRDVVKTAPLERIVVETDSPYLAPQSHRGRRNEPAYLIEVAHKVAELRQRSIRDIARITTDNGRRLFRLS
ncbi:MAG: TatD family deoxyribonuclease [Chloroflexi bacterium]|jgi:TatD DNase family protein|uniref:Hydrolase TatD n=1 Tax=Candidatus Thermofonsia Clade 3 bacterium TaxID=2364212 RepID=A0A2M8QD03_9CHLR|nr:TatD family hydrolase [Candidatus Roseilinea sp. NK_OTU-006]PJF47674.1 MAG: hydrolase TatD [Candidatus Thermofonsia Clade 3 bacterium]RMG65992.1 MAG: TatD family deoxyribonuclease [Chloroflexota bacterium]